MSEKRFFIYYVSFAFSDDYNDYNHVRDNYSYDYDENHYPSRRIYNACFFVPYKRTVEIVDRKRFYIC